MTDTEKKELVTVAQLAGRIPEEDAFWNEVAAQLDRADEASKVKVESRLTGAGGARTV